jgi:uncharacterized protein (UPF0335 family)
MGENPSRRTSLVNSLERSKVKLVHATDILSKPNGDIQAVLIRLEEAERDIRGVKEELNDIMHEALANALDFKEPWSARHE